jgi:predicted nucleic acid-binding protein
LSEVLIDTNILVYGHDPRDLNKQQRAQTVLDRLIRSGLAVLSIQCLTEFYRTVRWRLPDPFDARAALQEVNRFARNCRVLPLTSTAALDGMRACEQYSMSFGDSLVWAVAKEGGIPYLMTEDFDDGAALEGVQFVNPFTPSFDIAQLVL